MEQALAPLGQLDEAVGEIEADVGPGGVGQGADLGRRRIGLAISDRSRTLARPLTTLQVSPATAAAAVGRNRSRAAMRS